MTDDKKKLQEIATRFTSETIKQTRMVPKKIADPADPFKKKTIQGPKQVEVPVTVCLADDFNELVQEAFEFPEGRRYDVKLDLWSNIQENLDQVFAVSTTPLKSARPMMDNFRKQGRSTGMVKYLLDYFRGEGLVPTGYFVIRFADNKPRPA